jgi:glyoxylase-like metal-dependent hydrolase (beta-lactamase superfamily II)
MHKADQMARIAPEEVSERLYGDADDLLLLDIRHDDDFEEWHIPGSHHIDVYDELKEDPERAAEALSSLPRDKEIVTVCTVGEVSDIATDTLTNAGFEARTLQDGMSGWSRVHRTATVDADLTGTLHQVARPGTGCLSYVLVSDGEAAVFEPSSYLDQYAELVEEAGATPVGVFDTHAHADHVSGGAELAARFDVPYYLHPADAIERSAAELADGQTLQVGEVGIEVIHTPGHSPGSVCFALDDEAVLTGDTLFHDSVGRVELGIVADLEDADPAENAATLYEGLQRLTGRDWNPLVLPAHDPGSPNPPVTARLDEVNERNDGLGRNREDFIESLAGDVPEHPPNFQRIKRVNAGLEHVPPGELGDLELGPNRCAAE